MLVARRAWAAGLPSTSTLTSAPPASSCAACTRRALTSVGCTLPAAPSSNSDDQPEAATKAAAAALEAAYVARYHDARRFLGEQQQQRRRMQHYSRAQLAALAQTPSAAAARAQSAAAVKTTLVGASPAKRKGSTAASAPMSGTHDAPPPRVRRRPVSTPSPSSSHAPPMPRRRSPRSHRLEMERLWSGGDPSPPVPPESRDGPTPTRETPKCALLFPGTGSQYVGMAGFLRESASESARRQVQHTWDEANDALKGFDDWVRALGLAQRQGTLGQLGHRLNDALGADARLSTTEGRTLESIAFDGPQDELTRSLNAQPAILVTSIAFLRALDHDAQKLGRPLTHKVAFYLGHSSGEFAAAVASGAIAFKDGVRLARLHGLATELALELPGIELSASSLADPATFAQMSAIIINPGHSHDEVANVVRGVSSTEAGQGARGAVEVASFNSNAQVVLSGTREGIYRACDVLREQGIASRAADLPVSATFHASFLGPAAQVMRHALDSVHVAVPTAPIISGADGQPTSDPRKIADNLVRQVTQPVQWATCLATLRSAAVPLDATADDAAEDNSVGRLVFLGPGKALANLARRDLRASMALTDREADVSDQRDRVEVETVATENDLQSLEDFW